MSKGKFNLEERLEIEALVSATYAEYGFANERTEVRVDFPNLIISLNHENPYMGNKFWDFLTTFQTKIRERGYKKKEGRFLGDFYIVEYEKI